MSVSGRHGKAEDRGAAVEQAQVYSGALVQLGKQALGGIAVTIGLPAAAAGKVAALILDEAHHIGERVAQKYADLMRKLCLAAQPPRQLPQQRFAVVRPFGQTVAFLHQKCADILIRKHFAQAVLPVDIDQIPVGAGAALENPDPEALLTQPRTRSARSLQSCVS